MAASPGLTRDALRRRMLAIADLGAAVAASLALALVGTAEAHQALWSMAFAPAWLILAKLTGLYDRDQRSLRHLTVDELPRLLVWASFGTCLLTVSLAITRAGALSASSVLSVCLVAYVAAFLLRALARYAWRRTVPAEHT